MHISLGLATVCTDLRRSLRIALARTPGSSLPVGSIVREELKDQAQQWALASMEQALIHADEANLEV